MCLPLRTCVLDNNGTTFQQYGIATGNYLNIPLATYTTTQESVIPEYSGIIHSPDIGMLTFSQPIGVTPATLYTGSDPALIGSNVDIVGFGTYGFATTERGWGRWLQAWLRGSIAKTGRRRS